MHGQILNACFSQLIEYIVISDNCCVQIYKSYMHGHYLLLWPDKRKFGVSAVYELGTCNKSYNQKVNYLTNNCLYACKKI